MTLQKHNRLKRTITVILAVSMIIVLTACSLLTTLTGTIGGLLHPATPTPVDPAAVVASLPDEEILSGVQEAVDTYSRAYNTNDLELLQSVTDPENLAFKRLV